MRALVASHAQPRTARACSRGPREHAAGLPSAGFDVHAPLHWSWVCRTGKSSLSPDKALLGDEERSQPIIAGALMLPMGSLTLE